MTFALQVMTAYHPTVREDPMAFHLRDSGGAVIKARAHSSPSILPSLGPLDVNIEDIPQ